MTATTPIAGVYQLADQLRGYVNEPRVRARLEAEVSQFWTAASALDVLGDTAEAIGAFAGAGMSGIDNVGEWYLRIYGLLNAFTLQQDAGTNLAAALGFEPSHRDYQRLRDVRRVRVAVAGHPTRSDRGDNRENPKSYFIYRDHSGSAGFTYAEADTQDEYKVTDVSLEHLAYEQARGMHDFLSDLIGAVEDEILAHHSQFESTPLVGPLAGRSYEFEKVSTTGLGSDPDTVMAPSSLRILREKLSDFESLLSDRDLTVRTYPGIAYVWPLIGEALGKLEAYFGSPAESHLDPLEAFALAEMLKSKWRELEVMARELDDEYSSLGTADEDD